MASQDVRGTRHAPLPRPPPSFSNLAPLCPPLPLVWLCTPSLSIHPYSLSLPFFMAGDRAAREGEGGARACALCVCGGVRGWAVCVRVSVRQTKPLPLPQALPPRTEKKTRTLSRARLSLPHPSHTPFSPNHDLRRPTLWPAGHAEGGAPPLCGRGRGGPEKHRGVQSDSGLLRELHGPNGEREEREWGGGLRGGAFVLPVGSVPGAPPLTGLGVGAGVAWRRGAGVEGGDASAGEGRKKNKPRASCSRLLSCCVSRRPGSTPGLRRLAGIESRSPGAAFWCRKKEGGRPASAGVSPREREREEHQRGRGAALSPPPPPFSRLSPPPPRLSSFHQA